MSILDIYAEVFYRNPKKYQAQIKEQNEDFDMTTDSGVQDKGLTEGTLNNLTAQERKDRPLARGVLDYFPDALLEVARLSKIGNDQHNPGQEMHWAKEKSTDHADCILRHLIDRGTMDTDNVRHSAKVAWRALALLQIELDQTKNV